MPSDATLASCSSEKPHSSLGSQPCSCGSPVTLHLVPSPRKAAPLACRALKTHPWFIGEVAEFRMQQGLSGRQSGGALMQKRGETSRKEPPVWTGHIPGSLEARLAEGWGEVPADAAP